MIFQGFLHFLRIIVGFLPHNIKHLGATVVVILTLPAVSKIELN